jgi:hypothetical protein
VDRPSKRFLALKVEENEWKTDVRMEAGKLQDRAKTEEA